MADAARIEDLRRRLDREPGSRVFAQLAEELRKAGQLPEAVRVARQGLLVHPAYPSARMTLGRALMDMRDLRAARAEFEAVLRGATDNILASRFLGECLEGLGDLGSALLQYRATLRLAPGDRNLEAQIRALEQKLTPTAGAGLSPAPPQALPARAPVLTREGAIPVVDVDGPMELETSFEQTTAWRPAAPLAESPAPASAQVGARAEPAGPQVARGDDAPATTIREEVPDELLVPEGVSFETAVGEERATLTTAVAEPALFSEPGVDSLNESFPDEEPWRAPASGEPAPANEAPPLSSSTLAELYFNQGFTQQAIDVYKELLEREPGNERMAARILELQAIDRELEGGAAAPLPAVADPRARRREALQRTITRLEGFLATVQEGPPVTAFADSLKDVAARVPETQVLMLMGTDGIPIERLVVRPDANLEAVAAEFTTLLRASVSAAGDTGLGALLELCVVTEKMTALLVGITAEYFLFAALEPGALIGRARFALRLAGLSLEREFR